MSMADYQMADDASRKGDKDGWAWIPCSLANPTGKRNQANMDQAFALVLDIDSGMSLDEVKRGIEGIEAFVHTSFSHTPEQPKWRIAMPLATPIPARDLGKLFDVFQIDYDGLLDSSCGHDPARLYYLPKCPKGAEALFHAEHLTGELLDAAKLITAPALIVETTHGSSVVPVATYGPIEEGVSEGGRNSAAFKLAAKKFNDGMSLEAVREFMARWNDKNIPPLDEAELDRTIRSAMKKVKSDVAADTAETAAIVTEMNEQYAYVAKYNGIYRFGHCDFVKITDLRQQYANKKLKIMHEGKPKYLTYADIWLHSPNRLTYKDVNFIPGSPAIAGDTVNLWTGWGVNAVEGDMKPWHDYMAYLFPVDPEMRKWVTQWLAYPIQYPGAKLSTAVVLWSIKQGVGKSMLGETIGKLYGDNFKTITAVELHASFNGWMSNAQFILGEENASSDHRADSNRLKSLITGETVYVNEKYMPAMQLRNCANFLFTSNHPDAFHLSDTDRRFFVHEITAPRASDDFYKQFVDWRDKQGGAAALMHYLANLDLTGFESKGNAPMTESKLDMIRHSKSEVERWVSEVLDSEESVIEEFGKEVLTVDDMVERFNQNFRSRTNTTAMSKAMRRHQYHKQRRVSTKRGRKMLVPLCNHEKWEAEDNASWAAEYDKPDPKRMMI